MGAGGAACGARGAQLAFGQQVHTCYDLLHADVIVSLDCDFLASGPGWLRYARQFAARRRVRGENLSMNRLYVVEPMPTATGTKADHRMPVRVEEVEQFAWELAAALGVAQGAGPKSENPTFRQLAGSAGQDLKAHHGRSVILAGPQQPPAVHALAHAMNAALGNVGQTVFYTDPVEAKPVDQLASLQDLVKDLDAGAVDVLLILGGNPAYNAPVELGMRDRLKKAKLRIHLSLYDDETSEVCQWHLPETHFLETWSDARAFDGTVTIMQPLIAPLYGGKSAHEVLAMLTDIPQRSGYDIVKSYWSEAAHGSGFRNLVAQGGARRRGAGYRAAGEDAGAADGLGVPAAEAQAGGGDCFPSGSLGLRRPLRQQRLAAGTAAADHQDHLGQSGDHESRRPRTSTDVQIGRHGGGEVPGPHSCRCRCSSSRAMPIAA